MSPVNGDAPRPDAHPPPTYYGFASGGGQGHTAHAVGRNSAHKGSGAGNAAAAAAAAANGGEVEVDGEGSGSREDGAPLGTVVAGGTMSDPGPGCALVVVLESAVIAGAGGAGAGAGGAGHPVPPP